MQFSRERVVTGVCPFQNLVYSWVHQVQKRTAPCYYLFPLKQHLNLLKKRFLLLHPLIVCWCHVNINVYRVSICNTIIRLVMPTQKSTDLSQIHYIYISIFSDPIGNDIEFPLDIFPPVTQSKSGRPGTVCIGRWWWVSNDWYQTSSKHRRFFCC